MSLFRLIPVVALLVGLPPAAVSAAGDAARAPVSLPPEYYPRPTAAAPAGEARALGPPRATSHTVTLDAPGGYDIDLTQQTGVVNHSIVVRNAGTADLVNPWVVANGRRDWFDASAILAEAVGETTAPLEKAWNIWHFVRRNRTHWYPASDGVEMHDVTKLFNVYGYGFCDDSATALECLWKRAGFAARCWDLKAHVVAEVLVDGRHRMFDADLELFYPMHDNTTVAGVEDCAADRTIVERLSPPHIADMYTTRTRTAFQNQWATTHTMAMTLRPGESLERGFRNRGKFHDNYLRQEPPEYGNGRLAYEADLTTDTFLRSFQTVTNVRLTTDPASAPAIHPADAGRNGVLVWRMASPYVFVGGAVTLDARAATKDDRIRVFAAKRGNALRSVGTVTGPFNGRVSFPLDALIAPTSSPACYTISVHVHMDSAGDPAGAGLDGLRIEGDIQCAPASLPALVSHTRNRVEVRLAGAPGAVAEITHHWTHNDTLPHRRGPNGPLHPSAGDTVTTTAPVLRWRSELPDDEPRWRRVTVSWDPEGVVWVSPALVSAEVGTNSWALPDGWLRPGATYYWRVSKGRAEDQRGPAWSFTVAPESGGAGDGSVY